MANGTGIPEEKNARRSAPSRPGITIKPTKQTCAILGALSALTLAGAVGLYVWQAGEIAKVEDLVNKKNQEVSSGERIAGRLMELESEYESMQNQLRFLESSVSEREYIPTMLKQVEQLAKQVNLKVSAVRPKWQTDEPKKGKKKSAAKADSKTTDKDKEQAEKPSPYKKLMVDMEIAGTYWNIARFLYRMTEFPKIIAVDALSINPKNGPVYDPNLQAKVKLTGFVFRTPEEEAEDAANAEAEKTTEPGKKTEPAKTGRSASERTVPNASNGEA
jgi:Tfp pilus assembly protein PilO